MKKVPIVLGLTSLIVILAFGLYRLKPSVTSENGPLYWIDPMEPKIHYPKPGKSRMDMKLVPVYEDNISANSSNSVRISPQVVNNLGIRTSTVKRGILLRKIETVGYVEPNEKNVSHIHSYDGWIKKLAVKTVGETVQKDQLLMQFYSPDLVNAQEQYLIALENKNKRLEDAASYKLQVLNISGAQIEKIKATGHALPLIDVFAPQSGIVAKLNVREGMYVTRETEIMSLVDLSSIWIIAQVFEQQANWIATGQKAEMSLPAFPGKIWQGTVEYIYPELDPLTRTLKIRFYFDNPEFLLKPNMYVNVTLFSGSKEDILTIPSEALIRKAHSNHVIKALKEGMFQVQPVSTGIETNDQVEILSGLNEGDQVVTSGQFLIDSEANLKTNIERINTETKND